jgi:uncharacterized protein YbjT (DUF2867 family)
MILVTGATGHVGSAVAEKLASEGIAHRLMVRRPPDAGISDLADVAVADWEAPETVKRAFEGIDTVFLMVPGIGIDHARQAVRLAAAAQARIVLLSSYNVLGDPTPAMGRWHEARERLVIDADVPFTILRPSGFMTNAFEWVPTLRTDGYVLDPVGPGRLALIDPVDVAAVATLALTEDGHASERYTLTGDEALTVSEQVARLSKAIGREIGIRAVDSPEDAVRFRYPHGAPPALSAALVEGLTSMRADTVGLRTDTISRLLGQRPRTFGEWCQLHAETFLAALDAPPTDGR